MKLNDKIRILRKARGLSQMDLGFLLSDDGVSRQAVSNWENATYEPKLDNIKDIAKALNVSIDVLLDDEIDLNNPSVLHAVLNNDYKNDDKHKMLICYSIYRSYKVISVILGALLVLVFLFMFIYGNIVMNSIKISQVEAPDAPTNILGGLKELQNYVVLVSARDQELQDNMLIMFKYVTYISLALMVSFLFTFIFVSIKAKRKIAILSQNSLVIYKKKPIYIKLDDIHSIVKNKWGLVVQTNTNSFQLNFVSNKEEIINMYYQLKLINSTM